MANKQNANTTGKSTSGMMPDGIADGVSVVGKVIKKTGATASTIGAVTKLGIPAIILGAVLLPTILAPFAAVANVVIYAFIGYAILKKTGHLPAALDRDAISARKQQAMGEPADMDMAQRQ